MGGQCHELFNPLFRDSKPFGPEIPICWSIFEHDFNKVE